ncbi:DUF802 domain-containing protein [Luteimonas abyssi]|uniref:DUF802 domain-containing protein n=1 Tax=Luteimonas abyssi TaxID=1247514 RepID=UPI000737B749|nr:DUF802 domain-containing protein [Luteimonas abyssi]
MRKLLLPLFVFSAGLAIIGWIAAGYVGTHLLALTVTALIGALYLAGVRELVRDRQVTATLDAAVDALSEPPQALEAWLERMDPALRAPVRLRVEGERVPLPGPALTPYLVGLLVLLGMLGTLLGMTIMLRGTGLALESAVDLQAMRDSLAAPVRGLGVAFGTSIAGVAASAALGWLSAWVRRERVRAVQRLDAAAASHLRGFSRAQQREAAFALLQRQTEQMPALVERLQAMMDGLERQQRAANDALTSRQDDFHARTEAVYAQLAGAVERSLRESVAESARAASDALQPTVEATMAAIARETAQLHAGIGQAVDRQVAGVSASLEAAAAHVDAGWRSVHDDQQQTHAALVQALREALSEAGVGFGRRADALIDGVSAHLHDAGERLATGWREALAQQEAAHAAQAARQAEAMAEAATALERQNSASLAAIEQVQARQQAALAEQDTQRLSAWTTALTGMGATLRDDWTRAGADMAAQHQAVCDTLVSTAEEITAQTRTHAGETLAEISRLVDAASEAPRVAADVVAELREKLSDSMVRDTAMVEERNRLLATLETLLGAVTHASTEQRAAVDALVETSAGLLERVGSGFAARVDAEAGRLDAAAERVAIGAADVASLGEAFAAAVRTFGETGLQLSTRLEGVESALEKSIARSDEQLAYYVAQAREVVDLSLLAQKQIVDDLQRLGARDAAAGATPA